ncbi:TadE/TadG family type IV pilus assembly protein [Roseibium sp.]|uniref:TadE/TadG family type IV pilus assembly protein n=1 Tax=Roseibium sp. TaxID=1936156 RepID=UPI003B51756C
MNRGLKNLRSFGGHRRNLPAALSRFWTDKRGVSAIEFAMILPFMLVLLLGMAEVTDALNQDRKVSRMANAITDLVAQAETVTTGELDNVLALGATILQPYSTTNLNIIVASVSFDEDGDASVDWSYDDAGNNPWPSGSAPPITLPGTVAAANTSIVLGQATLGYTPPFAGVLNQYFSRSSSITLSDTYYLRPRLTGQVPCSNC